MARKLCRKNFRSVSPSSVGVNPAPPHSWQSVHPVSVASSRHTPAPRQNVHVSSRSLRRSLSLVITAPGGFERSLMANDPRMYGDNEPYRAAATRIDQEDANRS